MIKWLCTLMITALLIVPAFAQEKEGEPADKPAEEKKDKEDKQSKEGKQPKEKKQDAVFGHPDWPKLEPESIEEKTTERIDDVKKIKSDPRLRAEQVFTVGEVVSGYRAGLRVFIVDYAVETLISYLKADFFFIVRMKCPEALAKICKEKTENVRVKYLEEKIKAGESANETPEQVKEASKKQREKARAALLVALKEDKKCDVREQCAGFLPDLAKDKEVVDALIERLLKDEWSKVRAMCVNSLEKIDDPSCVEALRQALDKDPYSTVRAPAALALLEFKDREAEPLFIKGLKDGWSNVRLNCARALGVLGSPKALQPLAESLNDKYYIVRSEAALSLGKIGDASVLPALQEAAKDKDATVRESVYEAIAKIAGRHGSLQKKAADFLAGTGLAEKVFGPRLFAIRGLVKLNDERGAKQVIEILKSERMFERIEAIQLAAEEKITDPGVRAVIEKIAKSDNKGALDAKKAAEALKKLKGK